MSLASDAKLAAALPDKGLGPHVVVIRISLHGRVPQHADPNGDPVTARTDNLLGLQMYWDETGSEGREPRWHVRARASSSTSTPATS